MRLVVEENKPKQVRYHKIKCLTCCREISKGALNQHMGHSVHYINKNGEIDD